MSAFVLLVFVLVATFGQPLSRASRVAHVAWALVVISLVAALLVDAKGWP